MPELGLSLGLWLFSFREIERWWLRWFTIAGELIPIPEEEAAAATERAIASELEAAEAKLEATQAKRRAEILAQRLRQLGVNPNGARSLKSLNFGSRSHSPRPKTGGTQGEFSADNLKTVTLP